MKLNGLNSATQNSGCVHKITKQDEAVVDWIFDVTRTMHRIFSNIEVRRINGSVTPVRMRRNSLLLGMYWRRMLDIGLEENIQFSSESHYLSAFLFAVREAVNPRHGDSEDEVNERQMGMRLMHSLISRFGFDYSISKLDDIRRNHESNTSSLTDYLKSLKYAYSKLMIIRIDLYYNQSCHKAAQSEESAKKHWCQLLKLINSKFKTSFAGYAVKFEYGPDRGVHLHTVLAFDGSVVRQDISIAMAIGESWKNEVTQGVGRYFNCNVRKHVGKMKYPAVGTFTAKDDSFCTAMEHVASYVTKPDLLVRSVVPGLQRSFRRGEVTQRQKERIARRSEKNKFASSTLSGLSTRTTCMPSVTSCADSTI